MDSNSIKQDPIDNDSHIEMQDIQSAHSSSFRSTQEHFLHILSGGFVQGEERLPSQLTEWHKYIGTQLLGGCKEYLTRWAHFLAIPEPTSLAARYNLINQIVVAIRSLPDHEMPTIDGLAGSLSVQPLPVQVLDDARQSVLAIIGCLTMLFAWASPPQAGLEQRHGNVNIQLAVEAPRSQGPTLKPQLPIPHAQRSIGKLLGSYGHLLMNTEPAENGVLHTSKLNYATLRGICRTKFRLVDHVSSHLTFNPYTRELSVFAYPEYCALRCSRTFQTDALNRLVSDYYSHDSADIIQLIHQEVLLSYWVIFGSTFNARARFRRDYLSKHSEAWHGNKAFISKLVGPTRRKTAMTYLLRFFYRQLEQSPVTLPEEYWPQPVISDGQFTKQQTLSVSEFGDFKIFGTRLLRLQEHCSQQNPTGIGDMWRDRRDRQSWTTFWAVIIIGGASITLSLLQLVLTAVQVWEQQKPVNLAPSPAPAAVST